MLKRLNKVLLTGFCLSFIFLLLLSCDNIFVKSDEEKAEESAEAAKKAVAANPICERTEQVRDTIVKAVKTSKCEEVSVEDLAKVTILSFNNKDLQELKVGDFAGLTGLKQLYLSNNDLEALPVGLLDNLINLEYFYADNNSLQTLPENFFNGLSSLEKVNFYGNQLSSLPAGLFDDLDSLEKMYLGGNEFSDEEESRLKQELGEKLTTI